MPTFEGLVRPFTNQSTSPTAGIDSVPTPTNNAVLFISGAGQTKSGGYSYATSQSWYVPAKHKEQTTTSDSPEAIRTRWRRGIWASSIAPGASRMAPPPPTIMPRRRPVRPQRPR